MTLLQRWADRGVTFRLTGQDKIQPSRPLNAAEKAEAIDQRPAIFAALLAEWEALLIDSTKQWGAANGYEVRVKFGGETFAVQPLITFCATPSHEDRPQWEGTALCEECALFGAESVQSPLPMLDTVPAAAATKSPLRAAQGYWNRGL